MYIFIERRLGRRGVLVCVYLIFQLLTLYVLLYALQEVIGVKVCVSWRMPENRQRV